MTIGKTSICNNIFLLELQGVRLICHKASKMIEIIDKHLQVLKFFTSLFHEVTEIIEKAAQIKEFY